MGRFGQLATFAKSLLRFDMIGANRPYETFTTYPGSFSAAIRAGVGIL